jgi:hypothetical protein
MPIGEAIRLTHDQELLLRAILCEGQDSVASWYAWRRQIALIDVDSHSQRLLPLVFVKLRSMGIDDPELTKYKGIGRYIWVKNQLYLREAQSVLRSIAQAGIPAMPVKGIALTPLYYADLRLRPMEDLDIFVTPDSVTDAARLLGNQGWTSTFADQIHSRGFLRTRNAATFTNASGIELDVHWHLFPECCDPAADNIFWQQTQEVDLDGLLTKTLNDTDHLFHACVHGGILGEAGAMRWIVDSAQILHTREIDWNRFLALCQTFDLVQRLQRTLGLLSDTFNLPVPASVLARLAALRPSRTELWHDRIGASRLHPFFKAAVWRYAHYRRNRTPGEGLFEYLQQAYGTRSVAETMRSAARRAAAGLLRPSR